MTDQLPIAEVPVGFFEYHADFKEPIFETWFGKDAPTAGMYKVLTPWGVDLSKVSYNATPKNLQEIQVSFATTKPPAIVNLGLGGMSFIVRDADWAQATELLSLLEAVRNHLKTTIPIEFNSQKTILGFHVKPGPKPFREVLQRFVNAKAIGGENAASFGVAAYGADYTILMDNSLAIPNGLFVKITRVFSVEMPLNEIASILWKDEEGTLLQLGFRTQ